jgi:NADPH:quinone reductase-like Zn-dependent oxidoreductase
VTDDKKVVFSSGTGKSEHLRAVTGLIEAGELRPVIDRQYPFEQMAEAHRYAETEQKKGNIVIVVGRKQSSD